MAARRKKIVYLLHSSNIGGVERNVADIVTRLNPARFDPKVYCVSGGGPLQAELTRSGIDVAVFNGNCPTCMGTRLTPLWFARKFRALYRYLQRAQPDIIHAWLFSPAVYGGIAAKLTGRARLITHRVGLGAFKDGKPHYQALENLINRFTELVIVNSLALQRDALQRERIAPEKIHLIYGGVDVRRYAPRAPNAEAQRRAHKRAWGLPETAPVIGMVANLLRYKGYREFILAAAEVRRHYAAARFLCIGEDRGMQPELERLAQELGVRAQIVFTGQVQNVAELLQLLDIQVSASHEEGFSTAILEGMASGLPVIATAVGGTPEAVMPNVTGLLIPPQDPAALAQAILDLLKHPELALQFGENGRKRIEAHFSVEKMVDRLETLYLQLGGD